MSASMRAIQIDRYGGPEVIVRRELPVPTPGPGELLVKLVWSGINFMDVHTRQGKYRDSTTYPVRVPTTLGIEGAGTVAAVGAGISDFAEGDRIAYCLSWGSYADYALVPAWRAVKAPAGLTLRQASASMFHGLTAHYLAHDLGKGGPGVSWLIHAASGGIGQLLVQFGRRLGVTVYATTSSEAKAAVVRDCGADVAMQYDDGRFADEVRALTSGKGVDVVFDPIGAPTLRDSFRAARRKGLVVNFGSVGGSLRDIDPIELGEAGSLFVTRPRLADHLQSADEIRRRASDIFDALLDRSISIAIGSIHNFDNVEHAHQALEQRTSIGKPLLQLAPEG